MIPAATIRARLDDATSDLRLLDHPFYEAWREGRLTREDLAFYAGQYWRQVEAFPSYLQALAPRLPDAAAGVVRANLRDEVEGDHAGMWLDFATAVGAPAASLDTAPPEPETTACVETFSSSAAREDAAFALGMLYGYESQTPEVARTKADGLRDRYGVTGTGARYFEEHAEVDVEHSAELLCALEDVVTTPSDLARARAGARAGATAIWDLLDGVARARGLAAA